MIGRRRQLQTMKTLAVPSLFLDPSSAGAAKSANINADNALVSSQVVMACNRYSGLCSNGNPCTIKRSTRMTRVIPAPRKGQRVFSQVLHAPATPPRTSHHLDFVDGSNKNCAHSAIRRNFHGKDGAVCNVPYSRGRDGYGNERSRRVLGTIPIHTRLLI